MEIKYIILLLKWFNIQLIFFVLLKSNDSFLF